VHSPTENDKHFDQGLWIHAQRFAPHADLGFTDEEEVTLYLAGILGFREQWNAKPG
jgi:hypothetical protein